MDIHTTFNSLYTKIVINNADPEIRFDDTGDTGETKVLSQESLLRELGIRLEDGDKGLLVYEKLGVNSHILGLGERTHGLDRMRTVMTCWNTDPNGYDQIADPTYASIPFYIHVNGPTIRGVFINSGTRTVFDFGVKIYDHVSINVGEKSFEVYLFNGKSIEEVLEKYARLTGMPFMPEEWAFGHQISRYSYYPDTAVMDMLKAYTREFPISAIHFDIHYMDGRRLFTWNKSLFPDTTGFLERIHNLGVKVITILDPSVKADQNYRGFIAGLGKFIETEDGGLYVDNMWPGKSVFPDLLNAESRDYWKEMVKEWLKQDIDGIWLDMNEPTVLTDSHVLDESAVHKNDKGKIVKHSSVRNVYPYLQSKATYEAFVESDRKPFILSRSGFPGIQKYAFLWTGDNTSSWPDLTLQISMVCSLGLSGIPYCGCDLGGFRGQSSPELIAAYYRMALFFPFYRNHKDINANDQELFKLPSREKAEISESIKLRYSFMPQMVHLALEAHSTGHPIVRPLVYHFFEDQDAYYCKDEYMFGSSLLYAPQIKSENSVRDVYLPEGKWSDWWTKKIIEGPCYFGTEQRFPIFQRNNSMILQTDALTVFGKSEGTFIIDGEETKIKYDGEALHSSALLKNISVEFVGDTHAQARLDNGDLVSIAGNRKITNATFKNITLIR